MKQENHLSAQSQTVYFYLYLSKPLVVSVAGFREGYFINENPCKTAEDKAT